MNNDIINNVVNDIRNGVLDVNIQELFVSSLIKGLLYNLNKDIKIRNISVPHMILHTGDDRMWLETKGYDASIEPLTISNENNVYSIIPKCIVTPSSIDLDINQLTSPYSIGTLQYEVKSGDNMGVYALSGEFRRMPIKISVDLKYYTDSYTDMLELIQYIISNLVFIRTFNIVYMGQKIKCSYKIPENFGEEHTMEIDGAVSENREHSLNLSIEVESNIPVFNNKTIAPANLVIADTLGIVTPRATNTLQL
jgi:hypothetical protein